MKVLQEKTKVASDTSKESANDRVKLSVTKLTPVIIFEAKPLYRY